jgi:hypothetical protein
LMLSLSSAQWFGATPIRCGALRRLWRLAFISSRLLAARRIRRSVGEDRLELDWGLHPAGAVPSDPVVAVVVPAIAA